MKPSKVEYARKLPSERAIYEALGFRPEKILLIYDQRLKNLPQVRKWLADFKFTYPVRSGESLKDLAAFPSHIKKIFKLVTPFSPRSLCVVGLGGGSVGDFAGFLSSIMKRGVPLVHVPTTLLAAMDSAHGGKTALNAGGFKNQIGSFYPANCIFIVRSLFEELPALQIQSASGEMAKMALLEGGDFFRRFETEFSLTLEALWELLPEAIAAKYKVVQRDFREESGERQMLNLGHTLGHALESHYALAHGVAVGYGLMFALEWSAHQGYLRNAPALCELLKDKLGFLPGHEFARQARAMSRARMAKLIVEDKKLTDARHVSFIFLEKVGEPFRKVVTVESLLTETQRQGWTKL